MLDGLLYHESDLEITQHYTNTAGFTDHVFVLIHLLGFAFCPRIRDPHDNKLFIRWKADQYPALQSLISSTRLNLKGIEIHCREILRLATSIKQGTVTASLMLKKLASYPKHNVLAKALRDIGRIERTLFMLDWFRDPTLRRRAPAGLNKGEARNALAAHLSARILLRSSAIADQSTRP
ncbi:Transposase and inactivated derivatives, TnpA family [Serratia quinivorans]|nr:Transposase and inactivated derivatives, TnpA family [Serratia quinivorans]CAI1973358.1 Transposase and inactivated derivatives, TnpA family [Serratia proteamaculans]CAI1035541.1 Transposase and inactivated derivatives, TnpA family [Serratia quinivorans]CAI1046927.1 Transposase and inactivated derivatives, TnpA family [Serratia quinivorans]CAI1850908.1 Transposase and inactivated derivatives, TnpA family [Serratia quinivorans]